MTSHSPGSRWYSKAVFLLPALVGWATWATSAGAQQSLPTPGSTGELKAAIQEVLQKYNTPGAAVALVSSDGVLWADGIGMADVEAGWKVTADTLFRMGSISKSFVAISVLMLQEQGKLSLNDPVRRLAPEIKFRNPWADTDPVRLVHLLEHTAGFDDIHPVEYALNDPDISLREALAFHPDSRTVRWRPGTCYSYCNSGPSLAAYIVQKVSGQDYEEFVAEHIFQPLQMRTAGFRPTPEVEALLAKGYASDGKTELPYWHIGMRPSGALNASVGEMAHFVQMLINRGSYQGVEFVTPASVERMETPTTTLGAQKGLLTGYGLGNAASMAEGFVFQGHGGGMNAYLSLYGYLPQQGLGYVYAINSVNGPAMRDIGRLIRRFLVRDLTPPMPSAAAQIPAAHLRALTGFYEPVSPRQELTHFADRLLGIVRVEFQQGYLYVHPLFGERKVLIPVSERLFRGEDEPLPSVVWIDTPEGLILQGSGFLLAGSYRSVPMPMMLLRWTLAFLSLLLMLIAVVFAVLRLVMRAFRRNQEKRTNWRLHLLPLLACLCFWALLGVFAAAMGDALGNFAHPTLYSVSAFILSVLFPIFAVLGILQVVRLRKKAETGVWLYALSVSASCVLVALYLGYWGILGLRTWAY